MQIPQNDPLVLTRSPYYSGPTACAELRKLGYRGLLIGLTGNTSNNDRIKFISSGANEVLIKPLNINAFDRIVSVKYKQDQNFK